MNCLFSIYYRRKLCKREYKCKVYLHILHICVTIYDMILISESIRQRSKLSLSIEGLLGNV